MLSIIGRPVKITCISVSHMDLEQAAALLRQEGALVTDLVVLPEYWHGHEQPERLDGPTLQAIAGAARAGQMYVVCPLDRLDEHGSRLNSAVLIDRQGQVTGVYDKHFPYWDELWLEPPVLPGAAIPVFETDFGRLGLATCFDMNFPEVWKELADQGAELVAWTSEVSGGLSLQAQAIANHFYIVTADKSCDCSVFDITGKRILHEMTPGLNVSRFTLDLDRGIYHYNFNLQKRARLLDEQRDKVTIDIDLPEEEWFVLKAIQPGTKAHQLASAYGLEELRHYLERSRRDINALRDREKHL
jgi:predicted amidohydrolase